MKTKGAILTGLVVFFMTGHPKLHGAGVEDRFAAGVRATDPLSPTVQQSMFDLAPGFVIELVASEPEIAKPMNMAFDTRGRLWVTDTLEYPYPVDLNKKGRDSIKVLTDTNGDGLYDQVTTFADGLNIPIGLYPYGNGVLAWSIPNIWWFEDTDGDGQADLKEKRYGPLGWERDTHGMNASFTRGLDGWLYATHGFNNNSTLRGRDGSELFMNSGHTYRIRLDGSRVEPHTFGQVNPFGLAMDPLGQFYTADCHSAPVYQLIRGAFYPSFGKPHDGLGFAPTLMEHAHGSTAICGIVYYDDQLWPTSFKDNVFIGNVMTSRLNRDILIARGSSKKAIEQPDLLSSRDPWFRPVDLQLGPDGSLYIADFYNRIIGHYEVPLDHPGRDRHRGRIWKLTYRGAPGHLSQGHGLMNLTTASMEEVVEQLGHPNITRRMLATQFLADEKGVAAGVSLVEKWNNKRLPNWQQRAHGLWVMHRTQVLVQSILEDALNDVSMEVRVHALLVLAEQHHPDESLLHWARLALQDQHPMVQRAAAHALSLHPSLGSIHPCLIRLQSMGNQDPQLLHGLRLCLRNQLMNDDAWRWLNQRSWVREFREEIMDVALGVPIAAAGNFMARSLRDIHRLPPERGDAMIVHMARHADVTTLEGVVNYLMDRADSGPQLEMKRFRAIQEGLQARGMEAPESILQWGQTILEGSIVEADQAMRGWRTTRGREQGESINPWFIQKRVSEDGPEEDVFWCSLPPNGERYTGVLYSPVFQAPDTLSFYLAGHQGYPNQGPNHLNAIRLMDVGNGDVLLEAFPPRQDIAQRISWDLSAWESKAVQLELTDGDSADAYAWFAAGRWDPPLLSMPKASPRDFEQHLRMAADLGLGVHKQPALQVLQRWVAEEAPTDELKLLAARFLGERQPEGWAALLAPLLIESSVSSEAKECLQKILMGRTATARVLGENLKWTPLPLQQKMAGWLSNHRQGLSVLGQWILDGWVSPHVLALDEVMERLEQLDRPDWMQNFVELRQQLPNLRADLQERVDRLAVTAVRSGDGPQGKALFEQACMQCHQLRHKGALIGPQLDGIAQRGSLRILEDILDPNRNVDKAFQSTRLVMNDGEILSGVIREEKGDQWLLIQPSGFQTTLKRSSVASMTRTSRSLMPDNFGELLTDTQLVDLLAYLREEP